ncbi:metal ABC transporter ATP-binding protein [Pusillimonas sp.]|uniref:metal ABC transporter ATP-binding protein n=1 Tax=Pusillimonas sp. TaxID=3040095 RepID=UPI0037CB65A5
MAGFPADSTAVSSSPGAGANAAVAPASKHGETPPAIELDEVSLGWRGRIAVRDVSGVFRRGTLTAVVGPNGAGKSTLLKGVMGLLNPLKGRIHVADDPRRDLAFLPQAGELDRSFPITVYDLVAMGAWRRVGAWRGFSKQEHERVEQALEVVGLSDFRHRIVGTLSGGQLQRALFARLLLHEARTMLLDEPFAAIDRDTTDDLMRLLMAWHAEGGTIIAVLHDLEMVRACFPKTLLLAGQVVAWGETDAVLTPENLHLARHLCAGDYL